MTNELESRSYRVFRQYVIGPRDRCDRVENLTMAGMPDVSYCINGQDGWIEFKSPTEPKKASTPLFGSNHRLSQAQMNWFLRQRNAGGHGWILVCTERRWMLIDGCLYADEINDKTVDELYAMADWKAVRPIIKESWDNLRAILS